MGDSGPAATAAARALQDGGRRAVELRHPERGAAWLRARVLRALARRRPGPAPEPERRAALRAIGVSDVAFDGLKALSFWERAAFVAAAVERFTQRDVEMIIGRSPSTSRRLITRARNRYLSSAVAALEGEPYARRAPTGQLYDRINDIAARALGTEPRE